MSVQIPLFQIFLSPVFQSCSFLGPDCPAKPLTTAMNHCIITRLAQSLSKQTKEPGALLSVLLAGRDFSSLLSVRDVPERDYSASAVHFWVLLEYHAEPSINQTQVFSSSVI